MTLFSSTHELRKYVHGLDATTHIELLTPSIRSAERYVRNILTKPVYDSIDGEGRTLLQESVANLAMNNYAIHDSLEQRKQGHEIYKYELDRKKSEYLNSFQGAFEELILWLDENSEQWRSSQTFKARESLLVADVATFNRFYPIDNSYYFFMMTVPVQVEILEKYYKGIDTQANKENTDLCRACVLMTLSKALERFDFSQLPATIRNSGSDGAGRNASGSEFPALELLSKRLFQDGFSLFRGALKEVNDKFDKAADNDGNHPNHKYFSALW